MFITGVIVFPYFHFVHALCCCEKRLSIRSRPIEQNAVKIHEKLRPCLVPEKLQNCLNYSSH